MGKRIVIVGAGPGGLAAALLLAPTAAEVVVLEAGDAVGGRSRGFALGDWRFDTGPTFFLYPRVLREIIASVGARMDDLIDLRRVDPQYRLVYGDGSSLEVGGDRERLRAAIEALSPGDGAGLDRFLAENQRKLRAFEPCLERPFAGWRDVLTPRMARLLPLLRPWRSVWDDLGACFRDERVRLAFTFQAKYLGMSPYRCPSLFSILSFLEHEHGVHHPIGGTGAVMEALARLARALGVRIRTGTPVRGLEFRGRQVVGVRTDDGIEPADAVVMNADFARAMQRLVPDALRRRWSDRAIARKRFSCSTFMLHLGVDGAVDLPHHTIAFARDYAANLRDIEAGRLSDDPSLYLQNACVTDPTLAPHGTSALYVLVPVPHQGPGIDWRQAAPRLRTIALQRLARLGIPDLERRIRVERITTPDDWSERHQLHLGATFSLAHSFGQLLHRRPRNRFEDLDGVYLVGGGTHPGSGLPVIFEGARISTRLLCADLGLSTAHIVAPRTLPMPLAAMAGVA